MPSKKQYNLVHNDEYDTRIPLHSEEAFHRGIVFHAKFIGSMEVPRPTSRVEIVAAMRRIRYEFKAKGIKKKKVTLEVSVDGLKVSLRKKKKKQQWIDENKAFQMHYPIYRIFYVSHDSHDLKIFSYIARDGNSNSFKCNVFKSSKKKVVEMLRNAGKLIISSDVSGGGNQSPDTPEIGTPSCTRPRKKLSFKEPEFFGYLKMKRPSFRTKPPVSHPPVTTHQQTRVTLDEQPFEEEDEDYEELESQAMRVVRTVGQAFEVCHKLSLNTTTEERDQEIEKNRERNDDHLLCSEDYEDEMNNDRQPIIQQRSPSPNVHKNITLIGDSADPGQEQPPAIAPCIRTHSSASPIRQSPSVTAPPDCGDILLLGGNELTSLKHEIQLLRERLDQQSQQTRAAVAHARLLQDQLAAEATARVEAQTRTHQLLIQNKELLEHIGALVSHLREQDRASGIHGALQTQGPQGTTNPMNQQTPNLPDLSTLGQLHQRTTGQSSPWELEPPSFTYSYTPETLYATGGLDLSGYGTSNDQLHFQTQLLERLHNISPYQTHQRSPYTTPSPYPMPASSFLLSPTGKPSNSQASLRVSQANSFASSPVMQHKMSNYPTPSDDALSDLHALIRPLPCSPCQRNSIHLTRESQESTPQQQRSSYPPQNTTIILDSPPQGKKTNHFKEDTPRRQSSPVCETSTRETVSADKTIPKSNLATILRTPGPPPSRTTSARLPARNELVNQMQRKTWARHTTK